MPVTYTRYGRRPQHTACPGRTYLRTRAAAEQHARRIGPNSRATPCPRCRGFHVQDTRQH